MPDWVSRSTTGPVLFGRNDSVHRYHAGLAETGTPSLWPALESPFARHRPVGPRPGA
jgi:hypothetical protein